MKHFKIINGIYFINFSLLFQTQDIFCIELIISRKVEAELVFTTQLRANKFLGGRWGR